MTMQEDLFPDQGKASALSQEINGHHSCVQADLKRIGTNAKFFKTFSDFIVNLDAKSDSAAVSENINLAKERLGHLAELLNNIEENLADAIQKQELKDKIIREINDDLPHDLREEIAGEAIPSQDEDANPDDMLTIEYNEIANGDEAPDEDLTPL